MNKIIRTIFNALKGMFIITMPEWSKKCKKSYANLRQQNASKKCIHLFKQFGSV